MTNGCILKNIDAIIYCTGYTINVPDGLIPQTPGTESLHPYPGNEDGQPPYLYRNIFHLHADPAIRNSLAFLGHGTISFPGITQFELNAMIISQTWLGNTTLPSYASTLLWHRRHIAGRQATTACYSAHDSSTSTLCL